jgi:hypothetical protein
MLYAGSNLDKAHTIFVNYIRIRPRARTTIRQRARGAGTVAATRRLRRDDPTA